MNTQQFTGAVRSSRLRGVRQGRFDPITDEERQLRLEEVRKGNLEPQNEAERRVLKRARNRRIGRAKVRRRRNNGAHGNRW